MKRVRLIGLAFATALMCAVPFAESSSEQPHSPRTEIGGSPLARAKVWLPTDIPSIDIRVGPTSTGSFEPDATLTCDYVDKKLGGSSPKFACRLPDGEVMKVKYGSANGEVYAEVAASRLLWALGFGADRMYPVQVICRGCPEKVGGILSENGDRFIYPAAIERKFPGREIAEEWNWENLRLMDESTGGATRAERDAFKLLAVFLQHTDSKSKNQRVVCLEDTPGEECQLPFILIQDLGLTFGKANALNQQHRGSVNLMEWAAVPIWKGTHGCVGDLSSSWTGTLHDPVISEEGRQFLADLLTQLSDGQIRGLFETARVQLRLRAPDRAGSGLPSVDEWVAVFKQKREQIVERRCN